MNQPKPVPNQYTPSWDLVASDLMVRGEHGVLSDVTIRDHVGLQKYGVRLQPHNGRDSLRDAYEEIMDFVVYLRNVIEELPPEVPPTRERRILNRVYQSGLNILCALKDYQDWKDEARGSSESREEARKNEEREAIAKGHQRLEEVKAHQKPQDDPGDVYQAVWIDSSFHSHPEHTGHPVPPGTPPVVEVASMQPITFIPQGLPPELFSQFEDWKKSLSHTTLARWQRAQKLEADRKKGGADAG